MAPQQIGQFTIVAELAKTEGGVVYKATDPKGRTVALRTLSLDAPGAAEIAPGFRAAAKAASGLSSPNVAGIFGGGEAGGVFFVAVEFVEGVKLSSTLAKGEPVPMSEVLDLSRQVCSGLDHAHAKGIVHPELKPSNILVEWDGTAKIMDFGVPRTHAADRITEAGYYLSPEEVRGEPLIPRSNLFSWGTMLYQMVSGHKPFNASDAATLRQKIAEEMPAAPHELNPSLPPRVSEIILKALAKTPGERYASGTELVADLENYKSAPIAPPKPAGAPKSAIRPVAAPGLRPGSSSIAPAVVAPVRPVPPPPPPSPAPAAKPRPSPPPPRTAPPPAPAPAAAAKSEPPAAAPAKPQPKSQVVYVMAGVIALLLVVIAAGAFWMMRGPAKSGTASTAPTAAPANTAAPSPASPAAAAPAPETAATPAKPAGTAKARTKPQAAAAPVAAAPATGGLSTNSSPQGAEVQIDGRHEAPWVTPLTATGLAVGPHTVTFNKPGYTTATQTVQVVAGQNAILAARLTELAATLSVNSEPAGAAITLDGKDTGKTTPAQIIVAKGSHTVLVRKPGYLDASGTLETAPGQTAQFNPTLKLTGSTENIKTVGKFGGLFGGAQENSGRVSVRTNPKGAQVSVNGQPVKKTTPVDFYLNPGSYEISITLDGYKPVKKIVDVEKGGKLTLDETLSH